MSKFTKILFWIFWVAVVGILAFLTSVGAGIAYCATLIGIPFGIRHFEFIPVVFSPIEKRVILRFSKHPALNILWLLFGGLELFVFYYAFSIVLTITILGIPLGRRLRRVALYYLAPYGSELVSEGEYVARRAENEHEVKKVLNLVFNVFWVLSVGLTSAISSGITGIVCFLSILGIPFGIQHFKFIPLVFAPAGKKVAIKFSSHPFLNTFWLIFGGLEMYVLYTIVAWFFHIIYIGRPIARQLKKIAVFNLAPFGCEIVGEYQYSSKKNTMHDYDLLASYILEDKDRRIADDTTALTYAFGAKNNTPKSDRLKEFIYWSDTFVTAPILLTFVFGVVFLYSWFTSPNRYMGELVLSLICLSTLFLLIAFLVIQISYKKHLRRKEIGEYLSPLFIHFPCGEPVENMGVGGLDIEISTPMPWEIPASPSLEEIQKAERRKKLAVGINIIELIAMLVIGKILITLLT